MERYRGATLLTPNLSESKRGGARAKLKKSWLSGMKIIADFELSALLVTCLEQA